MFFPTNGVGFGHFTRMYALAKRFKKYSPSTEIVFFTTMPTLHLLYNEGFVTYHIAGRKKFQDVSASEWNALVEEHLSLAFDQHKPSTFIFRWCLSLPRYVERHPRSICNAKDLDASRHVQERQSHSSR